MQKFTTDTPRWARLKTLAPHRHLPSHTHTRRQPHTGRVPLLGKAPVVTARNLRRAHRQRHERNPTTKPTPQCQAAHSRDTAKRGSAVFGFAAIGIAGDPRLIPTVNVHNATRFVIARTLAANFKPLVRRGVRVDGIDVAC